MELLMVVKVLALPVSVEALVFVLVVLALVLASLEFVVHLLILIPDVPGPEGWSLVLVELPSAVVVVVDEVDLDVP